jgi:hypothetical protein
MRTTKQRRVEATPQRQTLDKRAIEKLLRDMASSIIDEFGMKLAGAQRAKQIVISDRDVGLIITCARASADAVSTAVATRIASKIAP